MNKKIIFTILLLFIIYFLLYSFSYTKSVSTNLKEEIFRLHIVANSDSQEDQSLKLKVRDSVINYLQSFSFSSKNEMIAFINSHKSELNQVVQEIIHENNYNYSSNINVVSTFYPTKVYKNISLPAGYYDGLEIKIGKAEGHNWWCVLFPPMCLIDNLSCELSDDSEEILSSNLAEETTNVVTSSAPQYKFKFKLIELFNQSL